MLDAQRRLRRRSAAKLSKAVAIAKGPRAAPLRPKLQPGGGAWDVDCSAPAVPVPAVDCGAPLAFPLLVLPPLVLPPLLAFPLPPPALLMPPELPTQ